jgi:hypothetical protein
MAAEIVANAMTRPLLAGKPIAHLTRNFTLFRYSVAMTSLGIISACAAVVLAEGALVAAVLARDLAI